MNEDKGFQDRAKAYYEGIQGMDESEKTFEVIHRVPTSFRKMEAGRKPRMLLECAAKNTRV